MTGLRPFCPPSELVSAAFVTHAATVHTPSYFSDMNLHCFRPVTTDIEKASGLLKQTMLM